MTPIRSFAISRGSRIGARIGVALLGALAAAAVLVGVLADFGPDAAVARPAFALFGLFFAGVAYAAARSAITAATRYDLRDDGIEMVPAEGMPQFVGWNQLTDLRFARFGGVFELHGPGEQILLKLSTQLEGLGDLINTILAKGILPKRRMVLPYSAEKRYPGPLKLLFVVMLALFTLPVIGIYQDSGSLAGLLLPGLFGGFALAEYLTTPRSITIDRTGITIRRVTGERFLAWEVLDGGALAVLRGPKGSVSIGALIRRKDEVGRTPAAGGGPDRPPRGHRCERPRPHHPRAGPPDVVRGERIRRRVSGAEAVRLHPRPAEALK